MPIILDQKDWDWIGQDWCQACGSWQAVSHTCSGFIDARVGDMRVFETGACRDEEEGKLDYEGFLSPSALARFAKYMHLHRIQADGQLRDSDNWQKGIPVSAYVKSGFRHWIDLWTAYRQEDKAQMEEAACALMFNIQGILHELLKESERPAS